MSNQGKLNSYIQQLHKRLRLAASLRAAAILAATALIVTVFLVLLLNALAFPGRGLVGARAALALLLALTALFCLALPLLRLTRRRAAGVAEAACPAFEQRLVTFDERTKAGNDPFLELLAADTLAVARDATPEIVVENRRLLMLAGAGLACVAALVWMIAAGPGYLGYGASLIWVGPKHNSAPLYDIRVSPGDIAVRRHSDQLVTAQVIGLKTDKVRLFARYKSALAKLGPDASWEPVAMQPQQGTPGVASSSVYQFLFAGLPEDVEYYVQAGPLASRHFKVRVVDLPSVKQIQVTYHYPKWTGMRQVSEEHAGDLRAIEGTDADLKILMDRPLHNGLIALDDGNQISLTGGQGNLYQGTVHMQKDGVYHVAAIDKGQQVRLSEDYFIATDKANPPEIAIDRPSGDYRASPIEEVTVGVRAADEFGLNNMTLHYSVNGGPDQAINMLKQPGAKSADGTTTLSLEDFKLVPGDLVSLYATAKDGHSEARTDISFIQADPFEREFSQSQQSGGGGGGGQGQGDQTDISKREKELIAATWKSQNNKSATSKEAADTGKFLSEVQSKLREQVLALAARMDSRDLASANEEFNSFGKDMQSAAAAMLPSSDKLMQMKWREAIPAEQKALQYLLRAEATFRQIEVAFGQQRGGGGGGGSAGRDLASLFDLELDTQKNQYETAQTGSPEDQRAKDVDDALQKLDALARRQEELAQQRRNSPQTMQERWQQEMLRRQAEQLQRQMEQLAQNGQQGQQGSSGQMTSSSDQSSTGGQQSRQGQSGASKSQSQAQSGTSGSAADSRVEQALNRLREADEEMKRSTAQQQDSEASRRAADQLRQATGLLGGMQQQQASGKLDSLSREADRLDREEHAQADRLHSLAAQSGTTNEQDYSAGMQQRNKLAEDRQQLSDDLSQLEKNMRNAERELAPNEPQVSSKLRDALSGMDQSDLSNRVQRTADWLRRGISPDSNETEGDIASGLHQLSEQLRQAQEGMGSGKPLPGSQQGQQTAALDQIERFRRQIESLTARGSASGQRGQNGQSARPGQGNQGAPQPSQGTQQAQAGAAGGQGGQYGQRWQVGGQRAGNWQGQDFRSGDVGNRDSGGGAEGTAYFNINTGNNHFDRNRPRAGAPDNSSVPPDSELVYRNGLDELNQIHQLAKNDPAAQKEIQDLVREMQRLDPRRFPGNPQLVEQLHAQVLNDVDRLELQLRRDGDSESADQVRSSKSFSMPPGYQDAVAEYFRRLSKSQ